MDLIHTNVVGGDVQAQRNIIVLQNQEKSISEKQNGYLPPEGNRRSLAVRWSWQSEMPAKTERQSNSKEIGICQKENVVSQGFFG